VSFLVYDNPTTMSREAWQDGELVVAYTARLLLDRSFPDFPPDRFFFGVNIGPWVKGAWNGDPSAMPDDAPGREELEEKV